MRWTNRLVVPACALIIAGWVGGSAAAPTPGPTALLAVAPPASVTTVPSNTPIVPPPYPAATVVAPGTGQALVASRRGLEPVSSVAGLLPVLQSAYTVAVAGSPSSCHLPVSLLAAIGQVESGSLQGRRLDAAHRVSPPLYGPMLNGHGFATMGDTDGGTLDGSSRWDRALGPMQFIPQTWRAFGVDGDGDGVRDPQDVEDAAAAAAMYLCHGGRDLSDAAQLRAAVFSYNHSAAYFRLVLAWMQHFDAVPVGTAVMGLGATAPTAALPAGFGAVDSQPRRHHSHRSHRSHHRTHRAGATSTARAGSLAGTPGGGKATGTPTGTGRPSGSGGPSSQPTAVPSPVSSPPTPTPTSESPAPSCPPVPETPTPTPVDTPTADPTASASPDPLATPTPSPTPTPTEVPDPVPSGCPSP